MRQLVGLSCVLCGREIGSIVEGRFCPACGCPVHKNCAGRAADDRTAEGCPTCGAKPADVRREEKHERQEVRQNAQGVKRRRVLWALVTSALLIVYGLVQLGIYLTRTPAPEFAGVVDSSLTLMVGLILFFSAFVYMALTSRS